MIRRCISIIPYLVLPSFPPPLPPSLPPLSPPLAWHNDAADMGPVSRSFDQEAACVLMTRIAVQRTGSEGGREGGKRGGTEEGLRQGSPEAKFPFFPTHSIFHALSLISYTLIQSRTKKAQCTTCSAG